MLFFCGGSEPSRSSGTSSETFLTLWQLGRGALGAILIRAMAVTIDNVPTIHIHDPAL